VNLAKRITNTRKNKRFMSKSVAKKHFNQTD